MLKLMYITNSPDIARVAQDAGVDRIFVDMEYIGKADRQGGMSTVQNHHTAEDALAVKRALDKAQLVVRCNPVHNASDEYDSTEDEINSIIAAGADIIMLPFFKSPSEVERFVKAVDGRAKTMPLVETPEAVACIDDILSVGGIDELYIGLNDLSLGYGKKFMFELLADGTVENLCNKFRHREIPYGFGGIASPGKGMLPAEYVIKEHYRLGSTCAILSRSFCNTSIEGVNLNEITSVFADGVCKIRNAENECVNQTEAFFINNRREVADIVRRISCGIK